MLYIVSGVTIMNIYLTKTIHLSYNSCTVINIYLSCILISACDKGCENCTRVADTPVKCHKCFDGYTMDQEQTCMG